MRDVCGPESDMPCPPSVCFITSKAKLKEKRNASGMHALRTLHRLVGSASAAVPHARSMTIHRLTMLKVADNSGAKEIKCVGHVRKSVSRLGDTIRAVVKSARAGGVSFGFGTGGGW